ncbi:MAG: 2-oxoglutarate dehydrogenase E1 component [Desulfobacteraceae bacterium]|nr:2-oxoglutarate dehydrogenase E1 component [Desulfobacteraceae bacterium]
MDLSFELNAEYVDAQYRKWKSDSGSVGRDWRAFFEGFEFAARAETAGPVPCGMGDLQKQCDASNLIHRYRDLGHLLTCLDPLDRCSGEHSLLSLSAFNLAEADLGRRFRAPRTLFREETTLGEIIAALRETYCGSIGVEYMHLQDPDERQWLQERMEPTRNRLALSGGERLGILNKLCQATLFEQFLHTRYTGQKRFSLEGAEVLLPMLDVLLLHALENGAREAILGMAHRGRMNVQVNVLNKLYEQLFCEFEDHYDPQSIYGAGDVKYHKGYMAELRGNGGDPFRVLLVSNPSHLEAVDPVVEGIAHARQEILGDRRKRIVLPLLIHGDAALAGQGIVAETLNLSRLEGYDAGGTLHIVINNQIGFTTLPEHARSTRYATDIAKMLMVPIFHVHGEDPEAAVGVMRLALDYRNRFGKDVFVDVVCYRRYGHNEGDEPYYTQPKMYERIKNRPPLHEIYAGTLEAAGIVSKEDVARIHAGINSCMESAYSSAHEKACVAPAEHFFDVWTGPAGKDRPEAAQTAVDGEKLLGLARKLDAIPEDFSVHPRLRRVLSRRVEQAEKGGIEWANAEALAFASLLVEGTPVRLSGQDSGRGTFSQRHSVLSDVKTGEHFIPLNNLDPNQSRYQVWDSMLAESSVLGFEYGYSLVRTDALTIWEAQFGDFANNAQSVFDQFISSGESKWGQLSALTVLLPHGFEGQGAEHSSARIERYLQLCAEDNMRVCYPSTPAQYFHLLRRQMKSGPRKPLIVFTPKSLLRHPAAVSSLADLSSGTFREVIEETDRKTAARLLLCSGKVYYDLIGRRTESAAGDTAIVRVEQFYPFPEKALREALSRYASSRSIHWVQEEPENMGAWNFMRHRLSALAGTEPGYIGRPAAASPAPGFRELFTRQREMILDAAFPNKKPYTK